jgi:cysteinyl-tRNA synthetase
MKIYNTLTKVKEEFTPVEPGKVKMYVCGPTVYDSAHLGHARAAVFFDVVYRYLRKKGFDVTYVRNFTDIDDKIINRANENGQDPGELAEHFIEEYIEDMERLGVLLPDDMPKVTETIPEIINFVRLLIDRGFAYEAEGDVYFAVEKLPDYGKLSRRSIDDMQAGARVEVDPRKKFPLDFALWKAAKPGEPSWTSPWGEGRPGWHIECSAMSRKYLGDTFDIHGGGLDLVFPHHENEIAQSEAATGKQFVKYWMHNGLVTRDGHKISKSLGNFEPIAQLTEKHGREAIRLLLLQKHYSSSIDQTDTAMRETQQMLIRFYEAAQALSEKMQSASGGDPPEKAMIELGDYRARFFAAMDDDLNTAAAIGHIFETVRLANRLVAAPDQPGLIELLVSIEEFFGEAGSILGVFDSNPQEFLDKKQQSAVDSMGIDPAEIDRLVEERTQSRKDKNFARADEIRDILTEKGIVLEDGSGGTTWKAKE